LEARWCCGLAVLQCCDGNVLQCCSCVVLGLREGERGEEVKG